MLLGLHIGNAIVFILDGAIVLLIISSWDCREVYFDNQRQDERDDTVCKEWKNIVMIIGIAFLAIGACFVAAAVYVHRGIHVRAPLHPPTLSPTLHAPELNYQHTSHHLVMTACSVSIDAPSTTTS